MNDRLNIAVTGLNATDNPGPGIPIIRSLKESKIFYSRIIGLSYELLEPGIFMYDSVDKCFQIPYPQFGSQALLERIKEINEKEKIDVIIPCLDAELKSFIAIEKELQEIGIKMCLPTLQQFEERQKDNLSVFCAKIGLKTPASTVINNNTELYNFEKKFPIVAKGKFYEAQICFSFEDLQKSYYRLVAKWGLPIIMQEFIDGTEFNVTGFGDGKGGILSNVAMRKMQITDKGKAWAGMTINNDAILELSKTFCKKTKWKGGFELELIKDKDNNIYVLEINPRIPAWIYLATGVGHNIPEQTVLLALGENPNTNTTFEAGKMFVRYSYDMLIDQKDYTNYTLNKER